MITISIIGFGNVGQQLLHAFYKCNNIVVKQIYTREKIEIPIQFSKTRFITAINKLQDTDIYIIAVSDDAIELVSNQFQFQDKLVLHTSGTASMSVINKKNRRGIFYPLQTFSKNKIIDFSNIPICLEVENKSDMHVLKQLANSLTNSVYEINTDKRKALHVAAVFVNNFVNLMYTIGNEICDANKISFEILKPLIIETAEKIISLPPKDAQTGPASRGDLKTISTHLNFLESENQQDIYNLLTNTIIENGKLQS